MESLITAKKDKLQELWAKLVERSSKEHEEKALQ